MLPKCSRKLRHIEEISLYFLQNLSIATICTKYFKTQEIAYKSVRWIYFGESSRFCPVRSEILYKLFPKLGVFLFCGDTGEEGIILTSFGSVSRRNRFAVLVDLVIYEKFTVKGTGSYRSFKLFGFLL